MPRFIAFLRALNTGKNRTVTMPAIRQVFESLGLSRVATAFTSGNVIFETGEHDARALETIIEKGLRNALGFTIPAFIRTDAELAGVEAYRPFAQPAIDAAAEFNIIFLAELPDDETRLNLLALQRDTNQFVVHGREIYWLRNKIPGEIYFSTLPLAKAIRGLFTIRSANTIAKIAQKYFSNL